MSWLSSADENLALRLDDLASSLDAGVPPDQLLPPAQVREGLVAGLALEGWPLSPTEQAVLAAAEIGGNLPAALRSRAAARRQRAELRRDLIRGLRYPLFLTILTIPVSAMAAIATGGSWWAIAAVVALPATLAGGALTLRRLLRTPDFTGARIPGLQPILRDAAEIPYLEAMGALYGAGVALVEAHSTALRAVPVGWVRARLTRAEILLTTGESSLGEAISRSAALSGETLQILQPAEKAGDLENAFARALDRRRHTFRIRTTTAVRLFSGVLYGLVALLVALVAIDFYSGMYARLRR